MESIRFITDPTDVPMAIGNAISRNLDITCRFFLIFFMWYSLFIPSYFINKYMLPAIPPAAAPNAAPPAENSIPLLKKRNASPTPTTTRPNCSII